MCSLNDIFFLIRTLRESNNGCGQASVVDLGFVKLLSYELARLPPNAEVCEQLMQFIGENAVSPLLVAAQTATASPSLHFEDATDSWGYQTWSVSKHGMTATVTNVADLIRGLVWTNSGARTAWHDMFFDIIKTGLLKSSKVKRQTLHVPFLFFLTRGGEKERGCSCLP